MEDQDEQRCITAEKRGVALTQEQVETFLCWLQNQDWYICEERDFDFWRPVDEEVLREALLKFEGDWWPSVPGK